jgi:hypothetical protein
MLFTGLSTALGVLAAPATYQCDGGGMLTGDFTPRAAQVRMDAHQWALHRARESREARYTNSRDGVTLTLSRSQATLARKGQAPLMCTLVRSSRPAE